MERLTQCLSKEVPYTFISTELSVLLGVTANAKFVVCHNGGYMHAVSAIGVPLTALFGLTDYRIWKPPGDCWRSLVGPWRIPGRSLNSKYVCCGASERSNMQTLSSVHFLTHTHIQLRIVDFLEPQSSESLIFLRF